MLQNGNIGLGMIFSDDIGYFEITLEGKEVETLRVSRGLGNAFVTDFTESRDGTLWLTHNMGLSAVEMQSGFRRYTSFDGINDVIISLCEDKGDLYIGTMSSLGRLEARDGRAAVHTVEGVSSSVWQYLPYVSPYTGERFGIAQSHLGVYAVRRGEAQPLEAFARERLGSKKGKRLGGYSVLVSPWDPAVVYLGTNDGLKGLRCLPNGRWVIDGEVPSVEAEIRAMMVDAQGRVWLGAYMGGVYLLERLADGTMSCRHLAERQGLRVPNLTFVSVVEGKAYLSTPDGVFEYDESRDTVLRSSLPIRGRLGVSNLMEVGRGMVCQRYSPGEDTIFIQYYPSTKERRGVADSGGCNPLRRLPAKWVDAVLCTSDSLLWFAYGDELYSYDAHRRCRESADFRAYVSAVRTLRGDSVLFGGTYFRTDADGRVEVLKEQPKGMELALPYSLNALIFFFGTDDFTVGGTEFQYFLVDNDREWSRWTRSGEAQYMNLSEGDYTLRVRAKDVYGRISPVTEYRFSIAPPIFRTWWAYALYVLIAGALLYVGFRLNARRLLAEQRRLSRIVEERTKEVVEQKEQIERQKEQIESSIEYASRIQRAMLPRQELMDDLFPEHFMLYLPRDIVSGDFYWMLREGRKKVCCIADCTGHGVPGGFMSMLGSSLLHRAARDAQGNIDTAEMLNHVRELLISSLHQSTSNQSNKDGMDLALFVIDEETNMLQYTGAHNPLVIVRRGEVIQLQADKMPVGIYTNRAKPFSCDWFQLEEGDMVYAFSDGFQDQFGGEKGAKFMSKNFRAFLAKISPLSMVAQRESLHEKLLEWMGERYARMDDVEVFGMRVVPWRRDSAAGEAGRVSAAGEAGSPSGDGV